MPKPPVLIYCLFSFPPISMKTVYVTIKNQSECFRSRSQSLLPSQCFCSCSIFLHSWIIILSLFIPIITQKCPGISCEKQLISCFPPALTLCSLHIKSWDICLKAVFYFLISILFPTHLIDFLPHHSSTATVVRVTSNLCVARFGRWWMLCSYVPWPYSGIRYGSLLPPWTTS